MIITIIIIWYLIGLYGFKYWWTKDYDLMVKDLFSMMIIGIAGPMSFIIGYIVHGDFNGNNKIIFKKRIKNKSCKSKPG